MRLQASLIASLSSEERTAWLASLTNEELEALEYDWQFWARDEQLTPIGLWQIWLAIAGRGFGKTRVGAEWVIELSQETTPQRIALIGQTDEDVGGVMVEGESGILARSPPWWMPKWEPSKGHAGLLTWPNGTQAIGYSAEVPRQLRGPQHHAGWLDELSSWRRMQDAWDMYRFGLRLGQRPRTLVTTTPTPSRLLRALLADKRVASDGTPLTRISRGSTYANAANLADDFLADLKAKYEGTRLGRQELFGELLLDKPGALWTLKRIEDCRAVGDLPPMTQIVVAIDPPAKSTEGSDECGIVVAGKGENGHAYILADESERGLSPEEWAQKAIGLYTEHTADRIVAEVNQGGDMVKSVLSKVDENVPVKTVWASKGKYIRAEPVSALYQQNRCHHVGVFKLLEDQMCDMVPDYDRTKNPSPDRLDAMVWAVTDLMLSTPQPEPRVRRLR